jgi:oxygen-independent coproporphyrinogen-3 oxidase
MEESFKSIIQKYGTSGPRYTSYPPAPLFSPEFGPGDHRAEILSTESLTGNPNLSLYFHIPFCDTLCYFCGCTMLVNQNRQSIARYLVYLKKEIDLLAPLLNGTRRITQVHWGGGTPTSLLPSEIIELGSYIQKSFHVDSDAEMSVEIDPRDLTRQHLEALRTVGFNRISLGVQDFDDKVQHAVNRVQSESITHQVIEWSRQLGFKSLNIDLIYGLPLQTVETFSKTLDEVIKISPERIAVYNFAHVPWMKKHQKLIHSEDLPLPDEKLGILTTTIEKLDSAGYVYIGMDHFAKPDDELAIAQKEKTLHRNFQGYSTKSGADLYGLGMSAISHYGTTYAQNAKTLPDYYAALDKGTFPTHLGYRMSFDDEVRKFVIMQLMCNLSVRAQEVGSKFGIDFDEYFAESLQKLGRLIKDGLVTHSLEGLSITALGRMFLRNIAMCFDAHLETLQKERPLYSKTV